MKIEYLAKVQSVYTQYLTLPVNPSYTNVCKKCSADLSNLRATSQVASETILSEAVDHPQYIGPTRTLPQRIQDYFSKPRFFTIRAMARERFLLAFPNKCVYCGSPSVTSLKIEPTGSHMIKYNKRMEYKIVLDVPYCQRCADESKANETVFNQGLIWSLVIGVIGATALMFGIGFEGSNCLLMLLYPLFMGGMIGAAIYFGVTRIAIRTLGSRFNPTLFDQSLQLGVGGSMPATNLIKIYIANDDIAYEFGSINGIDGKTFFKSLF